MKRPSPQTVANVGWAAIAVGLVYLDTVCEERDIRAGRSHLTGTTFSATNRRLVARIPKGPLLFRIGLDAGLVVFKDWYSPHILDHLDAILAGELPS